MPRTSSTIPRPDTGNDRASFQGWVASCLQSFPDIQFVIDDALVDGDRVAVRWHNNGTHKGDFLGVPASNNPVGITGMFIARVQDGQVAETWDEWDAATLMAQMGVS